ncbi:hypothetical protein [Dechloromonas sp. A34]|uniref:hypothetical protein n=1 Tax=Dechloromonas sp. A34 TaxID=447588 RepID=UPI002248E6EA|nr:hypothetical protein [Dechloromonas sp. A34]
MLPGTVLKRIANGPRSVYLGIICFVIAGSAFTEDATFSTTLGTAVLCLDDLAPGYFYNYLNQKQDPYKAEQGAYWFKTSEQLFGAPLTEVFISDGSSRYAFVGAVSSLSPDELAEAVSAAAPAGAGFKRLSPTDRYSIFVSPTGSEIAYQGRKAKIFCRQDRTQLSN